ncbi:hypothetical protein FHX82_002965 [Amycolatopsis bartoniae]|uniref:Uncharacterized protein n=1 Tax=Amycolatopsis bartoniae TaxID=941986 RepID=A0A8H9IXT5_9PSEU|nr:hypothetical protein [Amycolatopsis bartoniae]MBB2935911.1 hypothetical protein [Amycolatopsis bartoniae]TVT02686.1 hypothetical protein FNH07_26895 [Amycolatopsis bartoniae]GHF62770.1 hypothetical protein GCM10017566_40390 [Amycolatopsis bartoniae]
MKLGRLLLAVSALGLVAGVVVRPWRRKPVARPVLPEGQPDPADLARMITRARWLVAGAGMALLVLVAAFAGAGANNILTPVCAVSLPLALVCVPALLVEAVGWTRRHRSVVRTSWQPASATIDAPAGQWGSRTPSPAWASVTYPAGHRVTLRASTRLNSKNPRPVWVGGEGRYMVLLVPVEGRKPVLVAARKPKT